MSGGNVRATAYQLYGYRTAALCVAWATTTTAARHDISRRNSSPGRRARTGAIAHPCRDAPAAAIP